MKVITQKIFSVEDCNNNPDRLYIFGDNTRRVGEGGQACIRRCPNSLGICTKVTPSGDPSAYFSDDNFELFKSIIDSDITFILDAETAGYAYIIFPEDGLGTGLARLKQSSPKCWEYLCEKLLKYFNYDNNTGKVNQ